MHLGKQLNETVSEPATLPPGVASPAPQPEPVVLENDQDERPVILDEDPVGFVEVEFYGNPTHGHSYPA